MTAAAILRALVFLATIWTTPYGPILHVRVRRLGGERYLSRIAPHYEAASDLSGVPLHWLLTVSQAESGLDPNATSSVGARGLMQLLPGTQHYREWRQVCRADPEQCQAANLLIGARYLNECWRVCGAGYGEALARFRGAGCYARPAYEAKVTTRAKRVKRILEGK